MTIIRSKLSDDALLAGINDLLECAENQELALAIGEAINAVLEQTKEQQ